MSGGVTLQFGQDVAPHLDSLAAQWKGSIKQAEGLLEIALEVSAGLIVEDATVGAAGKLYKDGDYYGGGQLRQSISFDSAKRLKSGLMRVAVSAGMNYAGYVHEGFTDRIKVKRAKMLKVRIGRALAQAIVGRNPKASPGAKRAAAEGIIFRKSVAGHDARPFLLQAYKNKRQDIEKQFEDAAEGIFLLVASIIP